MRSELFGTLRSYVVGHTARDNILVWGSTTYMYVREGVSGTRRECPYTGSTAKKRAHREAREQIEQRLTKQTSKYGDKHGRTRTRSHGAQHEPSPGLIERSRTTRSRRSGCAGRTNCCRGMTRPRSPCHGFPYASATRVHAMLKPCERPTCCRTHRHDIRP